MVIFVPFQLEKFQQETSIAIGSDILIYSMSYPFKSHVGHNFNVLNKSTTVAMLICMIPTPTMIVTMVTMQ